MNIVTAIFLAHSDTKVALQEGSRSLTYRELHQEVEQMSGRLRDLFPTAGPSTRIGINIPNGPQHIIISLAALACGWTLVPVPGELAPPEKTRLLAVTETHLVFQLEAGDLKTTVLRDLATVDSFPELPALRPALIRFSSGTTGQAKGVVLSHQTLLDRIVASNSRMGIREGDRILWILPMAHHFAVSIMLYLLHGATTVLCSSHLGPDLRDALRSTQATVLYGSPYHYQLLMHASDGQGFPHLRLAVATAAALTQPVAQGFADRYGVPIAQGYGIIEVGLPFLNTQAATSHPTSVGLPQTGYEARVQDPDEDGVGEIFLKGPGMYDAYLTPWGKRQAEWFATGDLGRIDAEGLLFLTGRKKSVINVAGLKCFPEEIEAVLSEHPALSAVRVSALPHAATGSVPAAELLLRAGCEPPGVGELIQFCRSRLAAYKVPLKFTFVEEITLTASGKIRRH